MEKVRSAFWILAVWVAGGSALACGGSPVEPSQTHTLTGSVRSRYIEEAVPDAKIEVTSTAGGGLAGSAPIVTVTSDVNGHFTVTGLRGIVTVRTTKAGFHPAATTVLLDRDRTLDIEMDVVLPPIPDGSDLVLGQTIQTSIGSSDPRCDPQWDRNSPCRRFGFVPTSTRSYVFTVQPVGRCAELELHVFDESGARLARLSGFGSFKVDAGLVAGRFYEIRLMAYYECERLELTVN